MHAAPEDDMSWSQSSTHTAVARCKDQGEVDLSLQQDVLSFSRRSAHRNVQFDEKQNVYYDSPSRSLEMDGGIVSLPTSRPAANDEDEDHRWSDRWYTSQEYHQMKEDHKKACRKLYRTVLQSLPEDGDGDRHINALLDAYRACEQVSMPSNMWLTIGILGCTTQGGPACVLARTGMEQVVISAGIRRGIKQLRRQRLVEQVVHLCTAQNYPLLTPLQLAEMIQERCHEITRPSRLFAQVVGQANAFEYLA